MKAFVLSVLLLCRLVSARAEEGEYIPPSERSGLWSKIVPTLENIPHINTGLQYELVSFEGCEYLPGIWGTGRNSDCLTLYWSQWGIRRTEWKFCFGLMFSGPSGNNNLPVATGGGLIAFFHREF